jgi:hypothetical protein
LRSFSCSVAHQRLRITQIFHFRCHDSVGLGIAAISDTNSGTQENTIPPRAAILLGWWWADVAAGFGKASFVAKEGLERLQGQADCIS